MKNWYFSAILLAAYLLTFHLWMHIELKPIKITGIVIAVLLSVLIFWARSKNYFVNNYDMFWHSLVVLDILLEALLIQDHDHYGFYLCATAFTIVVGGYHFKKLNENQSPPPESIDTQETIVSD